jgi:hypothetical protein
VAAENYGLGKRSLRNCPAYTLAHVSALEPAYYAVFDVVDERGVAIENRTGVNRNVPYAPSGNFRHYRIQHEVAVP